MVIAVLVAAAKKERDIIMSSSMLNKSFIDDFDKNRMLIPFKEDGKDFICRVYTKEPKFLRQKVQRENEDGELEWVFLNSEVPQNWSYIGNGKAPSSLFHSNPPPTTKEDRWKREDQGQLYRIGYRML